MSCGSGDVEMIRIARVAVSPGEAANHSSLFAANCAGVASSVAST